MTTKLYLTIGIVWNCLFACILIGEITSVPHDNLDRRDMKLSDHNNSLYVRDLIRSAKAAELRNYIDTTQDPCRNFFQFACGNWLQLQPLSVRKKFHAYTSDLMLNSYERKINTLLQAQQKTLGTDTPNDDKVLSFYESCVELRNWSTTRNRRKLKDIINEFGAMPALVGDQWNEDNFDWLETVANISRKYGIDIILRMAVQPDIVAINPINRIYMHIPETLLHTRINNMYYLLNELLGIKMATVDQLVPELQTIEILLKPEGLHESSIPHLYTVDQLQQIYMPLIDLKRYLSIILGQDVFRETIYELSAEHHKRVIRMLPKVTMRNLANYIFYKLVDNFQIRFDYSKRSQEEKCASLTSKYFGKNVDNMIYRKYNNIRTEHDLNLIWNGIKNVLKTELASPSNLHWINEMTRVVALDKLDAMRLEINTFDEDVQANELNELDLIANDYIENVKNIRLLKQRDYLAQWQQPAKLTYEITYTTPRLFPEENVIRIPVSFLQPHMLWDEHYPYAMKFATLGIMIAHELVHGFDEKGQTFGKDGVENTWWDVVSQKAFFDRVDCLDEQFERYLRAASIHTQLLRNVIQPEIVAESSAVSLAYMAYINWYTDQWDSGNAIKLELEVLPNFNYNTKQLFFISYAQLWCEDSDIWTSLYSLDEDIVPAEFRVNAPLQNLNAFGKEFKCTKGSSYMNPISKCTIF